MNSHFGELRKRQRRGRLATVGAIAVGGAVMLGASIAIWGQDSPREASPGGDAAAPSSGVWNVQEDACADPDVHTAVDSALASGSEGPLNALLATPDEVDADSRDRQTTAWLALSDRDLAFQLCLRLQQDSAAETT